MILKAAFSPQTKNLANLVDCNWSKFYLKIEPSVLLITYKPRIINITVVHIFCYIFQQYGHISYLSGGNYCPKYYFPK